MISQPIVSLCTSAARADKLCCIITVATGVQSKTFRRRSELSSLVLESGLSSSSGVGSELEAELVSGWEATNSVEYNSDDSI